ncbi:MAG: phage tail family protein [Candidatus Lokiarchaeota archaeon]
MTEYALKNSNDDLLYLNNSSINNPKQGSLIISDEKIKFESKIEERSSLPGAIQLGKRRLMSKDISVVFNQAYVNDNDFMVDENTLLAFLYDVEYLVNVTYNKQVPVSITDYSISFDKGCYLRSSDNELSLKCLEPFWTSLTATTITDSMIIDINNIAVSSLGYMDTPGIITFTAYSALTDLQIYIDENKRGIEIKDDLFGLGTYNDLILDCKNGTLTLNNLNRINSITPGTGFFNFLYGGCTLIVIPDAICDIQIDRYERTFL